MSEFCAPASHMSTVGELVVDGDDVDIEDFLGLDWDLGVPLDPFVDDIWEQDEGIANDLLTDIAGGHEWWLPGNLCLLDW